MKRLLIAACVSLCTLASNAQTEVGAFIPGSTLDGINYYLPKTALRVVVETEKTVVTPGEFCKYAFRYLRLNDVPTNTSTTYKIKSVSVVPYGVADGKKAINVKVKSKTVAPLITLTNDGILLSVNKEVAQPVMPTIPAGKAAAPVINARDFMSQEMLQAGSTAKLAELCAQEIYDIRESRNALVRGEAENTPKDGAQLQLMLNQLDQQATALESLFKGTVSTSTEYQVISVVPEVEQEQILFRFSKHLGLLDNKNLAGEPILMTLTPQGTQPVKVVDEETDKKKGKMEKGIYYNVPVRETVKIYDAHNTYVQTDCSMAQFGTMELLSDQLFNKNTQFKATFFPENGGLNKMEQ